MRRTASQPTCPPWQSGPAETRLFARRQRHVRASRMALDAHSALGAVNGRPQSVVEFRVVLEGLWEVGAVEGESSTDPA